MTYDPANDSEIQPALLDPAGEYDTPQALLEDDSLRKEQKVAILRRWAYDANELSVAAEEGMGGGEPAMLQRVLDALNALGAEPTMTAAAPTKQGGT
ncbi:MAG: hypothetical protein SX243_17935 [Acidobacteriota bacterium]|nr:hypothetical protein [Acidobacteriota bacterium]